MNYTIIYFNDISHNIIFGYWTDEQQQHLDNLNNNPLNTGRYHRETFYYHGSLFDLINFLKTS